MPDAADGSAGGAALGVYTLDAPDPGEVADLVGRLMGSAGTSAVSGYVRESPDYPDRASLGAGGLVLAHVEGVLGPHLAGVTHRGRFAELSTYSRRADRPDPHRAAGLLFVMVDNDDTDHEADFERWYDEVHVRDVTGAAGFWGALRYRNLADPPGTGSSTYAALYVTDSDDVMSTYATLGAAAPGWVRWPGLRQVHVAAYRRLAG